MDQEEYQEHSSGRKSFHKMRLFHPDKRLLGENQQLPSPSIDCQSEELLDLEESNNTSNATYNKHNESIFDDTYYFPSLTKENELIVKFDETNPDLINNATLKALLVQLTSPEVIDYNFICDFFLTYRIFTDSHTILTLLLTRIIWSLQYINTKQESNVKLGKLVLLRTFVVLRHWLLNYFVDDFKTNLYLCDTFIYNMNQITNESNLINEEMIFEKKIIGDLKNHWISLINEFWNINLPTQNILSYSLPIMSEITSIKKISKSNTEISIHTNPSFRRSAMLSLYDQKIHHKMLIFDDSNSINENPQFSINNLLLQHQSSRISLNNKLQDHKSQNKQVIKKKAQNKHNHMNLKDSSVVLKKTSNQQDVSNDENIGFSTNGNIKLPSSKIQSIVPPTPVKKMDYILKNSLTSSPKRKSNDPFDLTEPFKNDLNRKNSIKKLVDGWRKTFNHKQSDSSNDLNHLINNAINVINKDDEIKIGNRVDILSARIIDELEYLIRFYFKNSNDTINEIPDLNQNDEFVDVNDYDDTESSPTKKSKTTSKISNDNITINDLSDLNIVKIDNLINIENSPRDMDKHESFQRPVLINWNDDDNLDNSNFVNGNDDIENNGNDDIETSSKFDFSPSNNVSHDMGSTHEINPSSNHEISPTSNISPSSNDIGSSSHEISPSTINNEDISSKRLAKASTQYFDVSSDLPKSNRSQNSYNSSISTPSNITQYDAEIADLGIAISPISNNKVAKRISFSENVDNNKPMRSLSSKSNHSMMRRDSYKSYISYDSAISFSNNHENQTNKENYFENGLKKKTGCNNLRGAVNHKNNESNGSNTTNSTNDMNSLDLPVKVTTTSLSSIASRSSTRKSIRVSTLGALTELPFTNLNESSMSLFQQKKRNSVLPQRSSKTSDVGDSSIFSVVAKSRGASIKEDKKLENSSNKTPSMDSSTNSVAIPGISNYVLKELAAIPDESFKTNDPIEFALYKLEGRRSIISNNDKNLTNLERLDNLNKESETHSEKFEETDIMDQIANANTEDAISYSTDVANLTQEQPLTPRRPNTTMTYKKSTKMKKLLSISPKDEFNLNSNKDDIFYFGNSNSNENSNSNSNSQTSSPIFLPTPKVILDGYHISSDLLSVMNVMNNDSHISFILSYDSTSLANHFTIIEKDMLQEIDWKELIELKWNQELTPVNSWLEIIVNEEYYNENKGVNLVISRFNLMVNWIISEILLTKDQEERINIISRFIHIAQKCLDLQNFSSLMQIILALTSEKIQKLKDTWNNLAPGDILTLKNLEDLASPFKNFLNIRLCINQIKPSKGCIPFVGLYLSDLIFNAERPKYVKKKATPKREFSSPDNDSIFASPPQIPANHARDDISFADGNSISGSIGEATVMNSSINTATGFGNGTINSDDDEQLINFSRFRTSVHIVKSLSQCIEWSTHYKMNINNELLSKCLYVKSLDEEEMNFCLKKSLQLQ
ncbi:ras GEF [Hyphopichia burtonii NRRL Y-1933]|uniref:Ras GEF n=1 Tax=Hyphopichia burtonii NRRL Y-1933 TaxID=984485 RepID=A0A1E4RE93_9ASCO|nr:ras GEF [Hyphopichia burtonii NRRL Y-1933]ODV65435.1 ras GEF [Hyphopichia burtonii NRRL Y-1933]